MSTLVCFHAHPDDESITTGGTIARASSDGHRVVLVVATRGELGEVPDDLNEGETLSDRRIAETMRSAAVLGIDRVEFLGYTDSGMDGWEQNNDPASFWQADVDEAAERLAAILREESADVLTVYDPHGNYGHPDHIQVHRVGSPRRRSWRRRPAVYEATMNRDALRRMVEFAPRDRSSGTNRRCPEDAALRHARSGDHHQPWTCPGFVERKRASIMAHASQVTDSGFFLKMPPEMFNQTFSTEWFIRKGAPPGIHEVMLAGL